MAWGSKSYRRRAWWWLGLVVLVALVLWVGWPNVLHERVVPACEVCGEKASTAVPDAEGVFHAYCAEHAAAARKAAGWPDQASEEAQAEEPSASQPADAESEKGHANGRRRDNAYGEAR